MAGQSKLNEFPKVKRWDGNKSGFLDFEREVLVEIDNIGGRAQSVWDDTEEEITDGNVEEYAEKSIDIEYIRDPTKAKALKETSRIFSTVIMQKAWHLKCRKAVYHLIYTVTLGDAYETVQEYGVDRVQELQAHFKRCYGSAEPKDIEALDKQYQSGVVRKDGKKMQESDDPVKYFIEMKKLRARLQGLRPGYEKCEDKYLVTIIIASVPTCYEKCIEGMKRDFAVVKAMTMTSAATVDEYIANMDCTQGFGGTIDPTMVQLEATLVHQFKAMQRIKVEANGNDLHTKIPVMLNDDGTENKLTKPCWNCGERGHSASTCQEPLSQNFCPARLKGRFVKNPQQNNNRKGKSKGKGQGKGKGKGKGGGRGGFTQKPCWNWQREGWCKDGDRCKFSHDIEVTGDSSWYEQPKQTQQSQNDKTVNLVMKQFEKNMNAALKRKSETSSAEPPRKKAVMFTATVNDKASNPLYDALANACGMITTRSDDGESVYESAQEGEPEVITCLTNCLHDITQVGIDSCSGKSVSTERTDFLTLDERESAVKSTALHGIGGRSSATGIGTMIVTVSIPSIGRSVLVIDPEGVYIKPENSTSPRFRILSEARLKKLSVIKTQGRNKKTNPKLECLHTNRMIPLQEVGGITVMQCIMKDARNYKHNTALNLAIDGMKKGEQSALYVNDTKRVVRESVQNRSVTLIDKVLLVHDEEVMSEMKSYRENETLAWARELDERTNKQPASQITVVTVGMLNIRRLTKEQLARLWHWRYGHSSFDMPVSLTKKRQVLHLDVNHRLCEDCAICDKAKFRVAPFPRTLQVERDYPPYFVVYADGCGGQRSMGVKSFGGAVGNFIFVDLASGDYKSLLYASKDQFPDLLERYLIGVLALQYEVGILRVDGDSVNISARVEELASIYNFVIQPMSAGTPQENGFAEKAVGDATRLARTFMLGAPHIHNNKWGLAYAYAGIVNKYIQKSSRGGRTPYQIIYNRLPNMRRSGLHIWGCPSQMKPLGKLVSKMTERSVDSNFMGIDPPSFLMQRTSDGKIMRVSPKKVRCHEGMYCMTPFVSMDRLEHLIELVDEGEYDEVPISVPSIKLLKPGSLFDPFSSQGQGKNAKSIPTEKPQSDVVEREYTETHQEIGEESDTHLAKLREFFLAERIAPDVQESIVKLVKGKVRNSNHTAGVDQDLEGQSKSASNRKREAMTPVERSCPRTRGSKRHMVSQTSSEPTTQTNVNLGSTRTNDHVLEKLQGMRPPMSKVPVGSRVMIESTRFDGDKPGHYSSTAPTYTHGTVQKRLKGGLVEVLWDGDSTSIRSHNRHLNYSNENESDEIEQSSFIEEGSMPGEEYTSICATLGLPKWREPFKTLVAIERDSMPVEVASVPERSAPTQGAALVDPPIVKSTELPCSTWEALVSPLWRKWIVAIRKEHEGWIAADVYDIVNKSDMKPGEMCVDIKEIFSIKRTGDCKYRGALRGDQLRKNVDYHNTFSGTVSADAIKMFFSLATQLNKQVRSGDVTCAYLQGKQRIPIYAFLPSYVDIIDMSWEELMELRKELLELMKKEGKSAIKNLSRKKRKTASRVLKLKASVYGTPDAGNEWALLLIYILTEKIGMKRSSVDGCVYYLTRGKYITPKNGGDSIWTSEYLLVLTWTDDLPYFGTPEMEVWFRAEVDKHLPMVWQDICDDFISIQVKQNLTLGTCALTQPKYWVTAGVRFAEWLHEPMNIRIPLPQGCAMIAATAEEHALAKHLPYPQLVGTLAFPACHTKMEIKYAVSVLSAFMHCWSMLHWQYAIQCLKYCMNTKDIGNMFSRGIDKHGVNVMYAYADSGFTAPRSQGCRITMMNGAVISMSAQKHSTVDTSTTGAELTELFLASNDVMGFRNLLREIGFVLQGPTVMYEDNQPAIAVAEGERNLAQKTKHLEIRTWKLRERIDDQEIILYFCGTVDMLADIGTKALGVKPFEYLRDLMNGYAIVRLRHKDMDLPILVICTMDLESQFSEAKSRRTGQ